MLKFSSGDVIFAVKSGNVATILNIVGGRYYKTLWHHSGREVLYPSDALENACELRESLKKNNPNLVFKKKRSL